MGSVRARQYDAVIGIGGIGREPAREQIAGKLTWVGIAPHKNFARSALRGPQVAFEHFWHIGARGPSLTEVYPELARRMYDGNVRALMYSLGTPATRLDQELRKILRQARRAPRSKYLGKSRLSSSKCCPADSAARKPACPSKVETTVRHRCTTRKTDTRSNIKPKHRCNDVAKIRQCR